MYRFLLAAILVGAAGVGYAEDLIIPTIPQVDNERYNKISDKEMLSIAEKEVKEMQQDLAIALRLRKVASGEKDVIYVNCVDKKLSLIKSYLAASLPASSVLQEAVTNSETQKSIDEFKKIDISYQQVKSLRAEAEECVGQLAFMVGKSTAQVEVDQDIVWEDDPTAKALFNTPVCRPPAASPY
jgi:hypothetical protein